MSISPAFSASVTGEIRSGVLIVTIDNPPVNATSADVRKGLMAALDHAAAQDDIRALVLTGKGRTFIGGADIKEFGQPAIDPTLPWVVSAIEAFTKPVVAAINGAALGGGLEVALACHGRIAFSGAAMALPEVKLGIVPGAGGTQRLPRLVGAMGALDMIATGRTVDAHEALTLGLIDVIAANDLIESAVALAQTLIDTPLRRTFRLTTEAPDADTFARKTAEIIKKARGAAAPAEAARLVGLSFTQDFETALAEERATFLRLRDSEEAQALRHLFFAERNAGKIDDLDAKPRDITNIGIAGTGLMGSGIASACLSAGYAVLGYEPTQEAAQSGLARIHGLIDKAVAIGKLTSEGAEAQRARLSVSFEISDLHDADLVIEAVYDDFDVKADLFRQLDAVLKPEALLATNTSYLDPDQLASVTRRPSQVLGLHFFSPANIMRLVEVVRCATTSDETLATGIKVARAMKKLPIVTGVGEGFIGNRIFSAYRMEAERMLLEGAYPEDIDSAMEAYGFPMGLFAVCDMAGLEIAWARRKREAQTRPPAEPYFDVADRLCELGRFGRKTGKGWYSYANDKRQVDPDVSALIADCRARLGVITRAFSESEIMDRLLAAMAETGEVLMETGIARSADDIDLVLVNGYGFPARRGGPMFAARRKSNA